MHWHPAAATKTAADGPGIARLCPGLAEGGTVPGPSQPRSQSPSTIIMIRLRGDAGPGLGPGLTIRGPTVGAFGCDGRLCPHQERPGRACAGGLGGLDVRSKRIGPALAGRKLSSGMLIAATRTLRVSLAVLPVQVRCVRGARP
jgi:hypothetical protein